MLSITNKPFMLSVVMLNVVMLSVIMLNRGAAKKVNRPNFMTKEKIFFLISILLGPML